MAALKEQDYECSKCGHKQTITFFANDTPLAFTCCVKCRAGFGKDVAEILAYHLGMFPVGEPRHIQDAGPVPVHRSLEEAIA